MVRWIVFTLFFFPLTVIASPPEWQMIPEDSSITFIATQNNAPVTGKFTSFTGQIFFDPANLKSSEVMIMVDMNSVSTSYADIANTLKTADWFNAVKFPNAIFKANDFTKTGNNTYQANGTLTIRDKVVPIVLSFTLDEFSNTKAKAHGSTILKRTEFGVGQGEWNKTDAVKDEVSVGFMVEAMKK